MHKISCSTVSYEEQAITYVWKNDEDTLRKSPSLTTLNAYLIKNATDVCDVKGNWRGEDSSRAFRSVSNVWGAFGRCWKLFEFPGSQKRRFCSGLVSLNTLKSFLDLEQLSKSVRKLWSLQKLMKPQRAFKHSPEARELFKAPQSFQVFAGSFQNLLESSSGTATHGTIRGLWWEHKKGPEMWSNLNVFSLCPLFGASLFSSLKQSPGNYSCLKVELTFTRDRAFYFTTVFIPVSSACSLLVCYRLALALSATLSINFFLFNGTHSASSFKGIILVTSSFITFWLEWNAVPAR